MRGPCGDALQRLRLYPTVSRWRRAGNEKQRDGEGNRVRYLFPQLIKPLIPHRIHHICPGTSWHCDHLETLCPCQVSHKHDVTTCASCVTMQMCARLHSQETTLAPLWIKYLSTIYCASWSRVCMLMPLNIHLSIFLTTNTSNLGLLWVGLLYPVGWDFGYTLDRLQVLLLVIVAVWHVLCCAAVLIPLRQQISELEMCFQTLWKVWQQGQLWLL